MAGRRSTGAPHDGRDGGSEPAPSTWPSPSLPVAPGPDLHPGVEVAGVRLTALVGRGGAGEVWAGTETASGARVALKLLDRPTGGREAALLAAVRHPHVLGLRRAVADPPALVTDLAAGGSLAAQVAARGTLPAGEVVTVLAPLADALAALHARGVVHGDVTATNILFVDLGRPVLADLGVAGLAGDGVAWATPGYAAPEVLAGARPGPAADVHGLAAAAWLALTGSVPPPEPERLPLGLLAPDCPVGLLRAVTDALDPDPGRRPAPGELAAAARAACPGLPVRLVPGAAPGVRPDEAITYRVREAAAAAGRPDDARWPRRLVRRLDAAAGRAVSRLRHAGPGRADARGPGPGGSTAGHDRRDGVARRHRLGAAAALAGATLVAATLVGAGWHTGWAPGAQGGGPDGSVPDLVAAVPDGSAGGGTRPGGAVPSPEAGPADLAGTVVGLVRAREDALRSGDETALLRVHDPDGTTLADDLATVRAGPLDVRYEVVAVRPVAGSTRSAQVELLTTTGGTTTTEHVVVELEAAAGGWRVRAVSR